MWAKVIHNLYCDISSWGRKVLTHQWKALDSAYLQTMPKLRFYIQWAFRYFLYKKIVYFTTRFFKNFLLDCWNILLESVLRLKIPLNLGVSSLKTKNEIYNLLKDSSKDSDEIGIKYSLETNSFKNNGGSEFIVDNVSLSNR